VEEVFFLARISDTPGWQVLGPAGLYLIDGADLVEVERSAPLVRTVESMTVTRLERALVDAAAAVRRGEPEQMPTG
jgi:hypothetical protein